MIENSVLLASKRPLHPPMPGHDEIARLDESFHQMARELTEASRRQNAIIENARDVICTLNPKGSFIQVSTASIRVLGYRPLELVGSKLTNLVVPEQAQSAWEQLKAITEGDLQPSFETQVKRKDGKIIDVVWSAIWSPAEKTFFLVAHDVTERRQVERFRQEVMQMVSHDLRSPMTSIQGALQSLQAGMGGPINENGRKIMEIAERGSNRILALINDLLDADRIEAASWN